MKATLLKTVVCVALVLAGVSNAYVKAQDGFIANDEVVNGVVVSKTVYTQGNGLVRYMKYDYQYDNEGRVIEKEAFKWNENKNVWVPSYKVSFAFGTDEYVMVQAKWNAKEKAYTLDEERTVHKMDAQNIPVAQNKKEQSVEKNKG